MNYLKQLISDGEQPSTGRVLVLAIVIPIMIVWIVLCIRKGEFITIPWQMIAAVISAVLGKSAQSFAEALQPSSSSASQPTTTQN